MIALLFLIVCFLAWSNGANDNFKGVASLHGSGTAGYRRSLVWATATVGAGSIAALFFARELMMKFSGKGLVPDALVGQSAFVLAVTFGAGATVMLATRLGFPISTTHGLTGALVGAGMVAAPGKVNFVLLGKAFLLPLLAAPLLAVIAGALVYALLRAIRLALGVDKEMCVCVGGETTTVPIARPGGVLAVEVLPQVSLTAGTLAVCRQRYGGRVLGVSVGGVVDAVHFLSAGAVGFARGLNDTPKIAALLLAAGMFDIQWGIVAVAAAMAVGGWVNSKRVAETMSLKLSGMNPGQGCAANLATAALVTTANWSGLPVSTTHVSVGAIVGQGAVSRRAHWGQIGQVALSWVVTVPCAAAIAALVAWVARAG